jgi:ubiquinone/menaquinone biosynthesis C-methylase UbiE
MWQDGWTGAITHLDFSSVVLEQLQTTYQSSSFHFCCADMTETLPFDNESFDLIVCKGALDAVLAGGKANVPKVVAEAHRVLQSGHGVFFLVTNGNPDSRLEFLEYKYDLGHYWQGVNVHTVPSSTASEDANGTTKAARVQSKHEKYVVAVLHRGAVQAALG